MSNAGLSGVLFILGMGLYFGPQNVEKSTKTTAVRGRIIFEGTLPPAQPIRMNADPYCAALGQTYDEGSGDVMVYVKPLGQVSFPLPGPSVLLDRRGCRFVPHTLTLQVGQKLVIRNSDGTGHNTHIWAEINASLNAAMRPQANDIVKTFGSEETRIVIKDDVHNWESANIGVFSHPYHTVSRLNGEYEIALPAGPYELFAWHEKLGTQMKQFEARTGETQVVDLVFK